MEIERRKWLAPASLAGALGLLAVSLAGCGDQSASPPEPDAAAAYKQFKDAGSVFDCLAAYDTVLAAGGAERLDVPGLRHAAREYSQVNTQYVAALTKISYPTQAKPTANELQRAVTMEIANLDLLSGVATPADALPLLNQVYYEEAAFNEISDRLREALGRPVPQASRALGQLELARQTAHKDVLTIQSLFNSAIAANDLEAAKEVSRVDQSLLITFRNTLDTIDFPGQFAPRVADLKTKLDENVAYSRRQVDVPTTTLIVLAPPDGSPEFQARERAAKELSDELAKADPPQSPAPHC